MEGSTLCVGGRYIGVWGAGVWGAGVWEWKFGNGSMGMGVWEWECGNEPEFGNGSVEMKAWVGKGKASNHVLAQPQPTGSSCLALSS